jgi:prevent-host-death family protein
MSKKAFASRASEGKSAPYTAASRSFQVSEDIMPIAELKARLGDVVRGLDDRRPLVITLNGKPAAVLMSPREFDRLTYHARFVAAVNEGLADVDAGRTHDAEEVFDQLEAKFGPVPKPKVTPKSKSKAKR